MLLSHKLRFYLCVPFTQRTFLTNAFPSVWRSRGEAEKAFSRHGPILERRKQEKTEDKTKETADVLAMVRAGRSAPMRDRRKTRERGGKKRVDATHVQARGVEEQPGRMNTYQKGPACQARKRVEMWHASGSIRSSRFFMPGPRMPADTMRSSERSLHLFLLK